MEKHSHRFVETYQGLVGFGLDRDTDEKTLVYYLQKFSDDRFLQTLIKRLSDSELEEIMQLIFRVMKSHLREEEYHRLFLKEGDHPKSR